MEIVLSIAGSDPSAGAGIQQDLKTMTAMGCYGTTVITALTSQNTQGVQHVMPVSEDVVASQLDAVLSDLDVKAIKIGMIPNRQVAKALVSRLRCLHDVPVIYDPVMVSTSGYQLMEPHCLAFVCEHLFPLCTLVTPNLPEAALLADRDIRLPDDIRQAGHHLTELYHVAFLLKGGHADSAMMTDVLFETDSRISIYETPKIDSHHLHGTGCTLSSAIASAMAQGMLLPQAIAEAKKIITQAIEAGRHLHIGHGNGPLWVRAVDAPFD